MNTAPRNGPDLRPADNWFGVFHAGQVFEHLSRGFTVEASRQYLAHCDPANTLAGNPELAHQLGLLGLGGRLVHDGFAVGLVAPEKIFQDAVAQSVGPVTFRVQQNQGYDDCWFLAPVLEGTDLEMETRVLAAYVRENSPDAGTVPIETRAYRRRADGSRELVHYHWRTPDVRRDPAAPPLAPTPIPAVEPTRFSWQDCHIPVYRGLSRELLGAHGRTVDDLELGAVLEGFAPRGITSAEGWFLVTSTGNIAEMHYDVHKGPLIVGGATIARALAQLRPHCPVAWPVGIPHIGHTAPVYPCDRLPDDGDIARFAPAPIPGHFELRTSMQVADMLDIDRADGQLVRFLTTTYMQVTAEGRTLLAQQGKDFVLGLTRPQHVLHRGWDERFRRPRVLERDGMTAVAVLEMELLWFVPSRRAMSA